MLSYLIALVISQSYTIYHCRSYVVVHLSEADSLALIAEEMPSVAWRWLYIDKEQLITVYCRQRLKLERIQVPTPPSLHEHVTKLARLEFQG